MALMKLSRFLRRVKHMWLRAKFIMEIWYSVNFKTFIFKKEEYGSTMLWSLAKYAAQSLIKHRSEFVVGPRNESGCNHSHVHGSADNLFTTQRVIFLNCQRAPLERSESVWSVHESLSLQCQGQIEEYSRVNFVCTSECLKMICHILKVRIVKHPWSFAF